MIDGSTVKSCHIEHQQTSDNRSVPEHQNFTSAGRPHRVNVGPEVNRLYMIFNDKCYDNIQFTSIGENKEFEWSHDCLRIAMNFMFAQMTVNKGGKLLKESAVVSIVK